MEIFKNLARRLARSPAESPACFIEIHPRAEALAEAWAGGSLATQSLAPGMAQRASELGDEKFQADAMSSTAAKRWLAKAFGQGVEVESGSTCHAFEFKGKSILCFASARGVGWQVALGPADEHGGGKSFGRAMLLPGDKECRGFWPQFCEQMEVQMALDPLQAKAEREALLISKEAGSSPSGAKPRL